MATEERESMRKAGTEDIYDEVLKMRKAGDEEGLFRLRVILGIFDIEGIEDFLKVAKKIRDRADGPWTDEEHAMLTLSRAQRFTVSNGPRARVP